MPAMVSIVNNFTETANVFGQQYTQEEAASGSGIIVGKTDDELLIVSNNHVVESADTLTVTLSMAVKHRHRSKDWIPIWIWQ